MERRSPGAGLWAIDHLHAVEKSALVCGIRPVIEALLAGKHIDRLLIRREAGGDGIREVRELAMERGVHWQPVPVEKLDRLTKAEHQGVIALLTPVEEQDLDGVIAAVYDRGATPLIVALDGVTDVRNMGAIARSAECFGAHAVLVPKQGSAQLGSDAVKSSAGALLRLPICRVKSLVEGLVRAKEHGLRIVACTEKALMDIGTADLSTPSVLVLGAEGEGISEPVLALADEQVRIPMAGSIGSLNVGVAAGIALYAALQKRR